MTLREQVVAALESGKYPQGTHYYFMDNKYCALGVMLHVHLGEESFANRSESLYNYLSDLFKELDVDSVYFYQQVTGRNDSGESFQQIANYLRDEWGIKK